METELETMREAGVVPSGADLPPTPRLPWAVVKAGAATPQTTRLVCFPALGGGASFFLPWRRGLPADITLCAVRAPGRESRWPEPTIDTMEELVTAAHHGLSPLLVPPYALFGHCLGGLVAFELARHLRRVGAPLLTHLFVSGQAAPQHWGAARSGRPEPGSLVEGLRRLGETAEEVLRNPEVMTIVEKAIKGDASVGRSYRYEREAPLPVPITVFAGKDDPALPRPALVGWGDETTGPLTLHRVPGGRLSGAATWFRVVNTIAVILSGSPPLVRR